MANKECTACIHKAVCKTAESCDGYVPGCKHFKEEQRGIITVQDNTATIEEFLKQLKNAPITILQEEPTIEVVQEWISVKDRLPEKYGRYLALTPGYLKGFEQYNAWLIYYHPESGFYDTDPQWGDIPMDDITHWMPLPQPPKVETIYCKDCEHLMFSDCYGECAKGYKGIVQPNDTCEHARRKPPKGE